MDPNQNKKILTDEDRLLAASMFLSGTSREAIRARFSEYATELESIFSELELMKEGIDSPEEVLLSRALEHVDPGVTPSPLARYTQETERSFFSKLSQSMSIWKSGVVVAALVLLVGGGYLVQDASAPGVDPSVSMSLRQESVQDSTMSIKQMAPPAAQSGDSLQTLDGEADEEASIDNEYASDTALVTSDTPAMSDYTNYNEKEL